MGSLDRNILQEKNDQRKKMIIIGIATCIIVIIILSLLILRYKAIDAKTFKLYINDQQIACSDIFLKTDENGNHYVNASELARDIGWSYENGEYGSFSEDTDSCYLQNNYEIASMKADSTELKKYIQVSEEVKGYNDDDDETTIYYEPRSVDGTLETSNISLPILLIDGQLYIPFDCINDICNCYGENSNPYRMYIYNQEYLIQLAMVNAANFGYKNISGTYENIRALGYGKMVVQDTSNLYGVVGLFDGVQQLGFKYTDMVFNQNVKEFFVNAKDASGNETIGVVSEDGDVIIKPVSYENISVLSDSLGLYLVEKDGYYGVLNRSGNTLIHAEYTSIGLPEEIYTKFCSSSDNKYLLYNNTIIVEDEGKYGAFDLSGKQTLETVYDLGYVFEEENDTSDITEASKNGNEVFKIDVEVNGENGEKGKVQGIVVELNEKYGVYDAVSGNLIIPCSCVRIYSITKGGETTYYMEDVVGNTFEFTSYVLAQKLYVPITEDNAETNN